MVVVALTTNVTNIQVHENCLSCESNPNHLDIHTVYSTWPATIAPPSPRNVRRETVEIVRVTSLRFDWNGTNEIAFNNEILSRTVRKFKTKQIEEEVK